MGQTGQTGQRAAEIKKTSELEKIISEFSPVDSQGTVPCPPPSPSPSPCPTCHCPRFWFDRYGGGPHCQTCRQPPAASLVARWREIATLADGRFAWADELPPEAKCAVDLDVEFDRKYHCYVTRDGKRFVIERRDWSFLNSSMIVRNDPETENEPTEPDI